MAKFKRIATFMLCLALILMIGGESILSLFVIRAEAATSTYSNVLDDLKKDPEFDLNDYPAVADDYTLKVIQIAEGENGELFVYVYQPSDEFKDYKAKFINMSLEDIYSRDLSYKLYSLTWLSSSGVFDKYIVNDFSVSSEAERYYNIAAIYRPFDEKNDDKSEAIDSVQYRGYEVAQSWRAYYYNNVLFYDMQKMDVVDIKYHATGSIRYRNGFTLGSLSLSSCDSQYVAFSIENFNVDKIYDADITYTLSTYRWTETYTPHSYKEEHISTSEPISKKLSEFDTASNKGDGWLSKTYTWNRIQSVDTFIKEVQNDANESFSEKELEGLNKSDFVFRFDETNFSITPGSTTSFGTFSIAENIGILRLHFLSEGKVYNLGCVSDLVGTDNNPEFDVSIGDNIINSFEDGGWWKDIMMVLGLIVLLLIISIFTGPVGAIIKLIWNGIKYILQCFLTVITAPFKFLESYFKSK